MNIDNVSDYTSKKYFNSLEEYIKMMDALVDTTPIGYVITDSQGNVLRMNPAHKKITDYNLESMLGLNLGDLDKVEETKSACMKVIRTKSPVIEEQYCVNGRSYMVYANPFFDDDNELKYVICTVLDATEIIITRQKLKENQQINESLNLRIKELETQLNQSNLVIHKSKCMNQILDICRRIANYNSTVLITGDSGTGKELIARYIYECSSRRNAPYIKVNCASIPDNLMESEFFGYESGSFTGAHTKGKKGLIELADHGTLLLDEVAELPLTLQSKFLRFLQEGEFYRIGGKTPIKTDVRIIAATNKNLEDLVETGKFREDLYYRLNILPIKVPSLSSRREDIPILIDYFVKNFNKQYGTNKHISNEVLNIMVQMEYKGNVRELNNTVERLLLLSGDEIVLDDALKILPLKQQNSPLIHSAYSLKEIMEKYEKDILSQYLETYKTATRIAQILKTDQTTISRKLRKYDLT